MWFVALYLAACGSKPVDTGPSVTTTPGAGTTTSVTCTCRSAVVDIAITRDGVPAVPDMLAITFGSGPRVELCGGSAPPCTEPAYSVDTVDASCVVEARLGQGVLQARCEDHQLGPQPCVCGQDADIDLDFSAATTAG